MVALATGCGNPLVALKSAEASCVYDYEGKGEDACLLGARAAHDALIDVAPHSRGVGAGLTLMTRVQLMVFRQCEANFAEVGEQQACKQGGKAFAEAMQAE
jgi:hypothetical protein